MKRDVNLDKENQNVWAEDVIEYLKPFILFLKFYTRIGNYVNPNIEKK